MLKKKKKKKSSKKLKSNTGLYLISLECFSYKLPKYSQKLSMAYIERKL